MAALLGVDLPAAQEIAAAAAKDTGEVCATANDNAPGQVVVSGEQDGDRARDRHRAGERAPSARSCCR